MNIYSGIYIHIMDITSRIYIHIWRPPGRLIGGVWGGGCPPRNHCYDKFCMCFHILGSPIVGTKSDGFMACKGLRGL